MQYAYKRVKNTIAIIGGFLFVLFGVSQPHQSYTTNNQIGVAQADAPASGGGDSGSSCVAGDSGCGCDSGSGSAGGGCGCCGGAGGAGDCTGCSAAGSDDDDDDDDDDGDDGS